MIGVAVVVQARMGSSRLPGKVLAPVLRRPVLAHMLARVRAARTPFTLVLATTTRRDDDVIAALGRDLDVCVLRGHPTDLLDRHVAAAEAVGASTVVKIPSDCPLIDPRVIDEVLGAFLASPGRWDYLGNLHPASWPDGQDVEVMTLDALRVAQREATRPLDREHTTPFLWDQPERFRVGSVRWSRGVDLSMSHRWTLDWPEDLDFVRAVYANLWRPGDAVFGVDDVLALLEARPDIAAVNARRAGVNWYRHHLHELRTVSPAETRALPEDL